ncbi:hypothetical protein FNE58_03885 [Bacillus thuringiensis]|nr:hypothetical protein FPG91_27265 [Bacillus thuringiensis]NIE92268.1 hypothetical protein [Bacillus sp. Ab-1751]KAB1348680.1 hypothetical protein FPG90_27455 [Bacillus thuringiensis]KAB1349156.1 hypothetical protein FPG94_27235 [Bacillus thuringiensis]KAB1364079.1 hypothetical protein FPG95_27710 [Bacillus thuringiensis]
MSLLSGFCGFPTSNKSKRNIY